MYIYHIYIHIFLHLFHIVSSCRLQPQIGGVDWHGEARSGKRSTIRLHRRRRCNPKSQIPNPKSQIRKPTPGTRNPEPGTRNPKPGTLNPKP